MTSLVLGGATGGSLLLKTGRPGRTSLPTRDIPVPLPKVVIESRGLSCMSFPEVQKEVYLRDSGIQSDALDSESGPFMVQTIPEASPPIHNN